ncbi:MAG: hypothetical protein JJU48_05965 [Methylophaga sp.]|nr:hypothetical protein [Methylophaga sp.]
MGVVVAYTHKAEAPDWLKSHYEFQIRTFWITLLLLSAGWLTLLLLSAGWLTISTGMVGYLILLTQAVWLIVRCVIAYRLLKSKTPHPDPTTLLY